MYNIIGEIMKYISGYRNGKKTMRILLEVTQKDLDAFDDLKHCICTRDGKYHPLMPKYQKLIDQTETELWRYTDYVAPVFEKYIGYEPIHDEDQYIVSRERIEKLLNKKSLKKFDKFMHGATCPIDGFYQWDVLTFLKGQEMLD